MNGMTVDTTAIWRQAARSADPYPVLLLGRSQRDYFEEGLADAECLLKPRIQEVRQNFRDITILEIGPGLHRFQIALQEKRIATPNDNLVVVDIVEEFLKVAPGEVTPEIDVRDMPANSVHFAFSFCLFQHLPCDVREFYSEQLKRVVRPGGRVFIQFPNADCSYYWEKLTLHRFTREEVRALFGSGWRIDIREGNLSRYFLLEKPDDIHREKRELFLLAQRR